MASCVSLCAKHMISSKKHRLWSHIDSDPEFLLEASNLILLPLVEYEMKVIVFDSLGF